jgi:molybdopterin-guanine dinucleotide biosynthesis protein A
VTRLTAGVLLTGGASLRMGLDKATLVLAGETLAQRAARVLSAACNPVIEVGSGATSLPCAREDPAGEGPLAGFLAGADTLALASDAMVVLLACDLPFVDDAVVRMLVEHPANGSVVPTVEGRKQYVCSRWTAAAIASARVAFAQGERAMRALLGAGDTTFVVADAHARALADVDTPDDLARLGLAAN